MSRKLYVVTGQQDGNPVLVPLGVVGADDSASFTSWLPGASPGEWADRIASLASASSPVAAAEELADRTNGITFDLTEVADPFPEGSLSDAVFAAIDEILATPGS